VKSHALQALEAAAVEIAETHGVSLELARGMLRHSLVTHLAARGGHDLAEPFYAAMGVRPFEEGEVSQLEHGPAVGIVARSVRPKSVH
jgi:hypothetical protein